MDAHIAKEGGNAEQGKLVITSDVGRDFTQNAEYFSSPGKAITEYVWNSIDYCKQGTRVEVHIFRGRGRLKPRKGSEEKYNGIVIQERKNGGGMSREDLSRFFQMHGETRARQQGRRVRGRYGTGKSAAFGIAHRLIVDVVKDGKQNIVSVHRRDLKPGFTEIPVKFHIMDKPSSEPDRTTIIIDKLIKRSVKMENVRRYLTKSINKFLTQHDVYVEDRKLEYTVPRTEETRSFSCPDRYVPKLGDCQLRIMLAAEELDEEETGLSVFAGGYLLSTLPFEGVDSTWSRRLFGEVDCPLLESQDAIPAINNTRSGLNLDNDRVKALKSWMQECTVEVVDELEKKAKERIDKEKQEKLKETARELEELLNHDFEKLLHDLDTALPVGSSGPLPASGSVGTEAYPVMVSGDTGSMHAQVAEEGNTTTLTSDMMGKGPAEHQPHVPSPSRAQTEGQGVTQETSSKASPKPRGRFRIEHVSLGPEAHRAEFDRSAMEIRINIDFPEIAVFAQDIEDFKFKFLEAEIAISEYAIAVVNYKVECHSIDVEDTASSAMIEYRRILNHIARSLVPLLDRWTR